MADIRVVVYDSGIAAMSLPGGDIYRWTRQRRERVERLTRLNAPKRTGRMARSVRGNYIPRSPTRIHMEVHVETEYALYVHEGVPGWIIAKSPGGMNLPAWPPHRAKWGLPAVRGQRANPFAANALREVMGDL